MMETVALGSVGSRSTTVELQGGVTTMPIGPNNLGTDLSGDHPISFIYDTTLTAQDTALNNPASLTGKVKLDRNNKLQCTACHNPHDNQYGNFLVMDNSPRRFAWSAITIPTGRFPPTAHRLKS